MRLRPTLLRCGPDTTDRPLLEVETAEGHIVSIVLDVALARALSARLDEIRSGRIMARPPSRRVLELAVCGEDEETELADTEPPRAVGGVVR